MAEFPAEVARPAAASLHSARMVLLAGELSSIELLCAGTTPAHSEAGNDKKARASAGSALGPEFEGRLLSAKDDSKVYGCQE